MKKLFIIIVLFTCNSFWAQKKLLSIEDVVLNSYSKLVPKNLKQLNWIPNNDNVTYIDNDSVLVMRSMNNIISGIIDMNELNNLISSTHIKQLSKFPEINWYDKTSFTFWINNYLALVDVENISIEIINKVFDNAENIETASNNVYTAFTIDNNLFASLDSSNIIQVTNESNSGIVSGQAVHRSEFGIRKGIFWSPKNSYLAFYQMDESMVTDYPLVEIGEAPAKLKNFKYPMAGQKSHHVKIGVFNPKTKNTIWLKTGEPLDQYLTCVTWDPTEKYIFVAHLNRDQNHLKLIKYGALTGEPIKSLFEEKNDKYVEPENDLYFLPNDPSKFLWFSERDKWQHLYLYNIDGELIKQVTKGK
jgi:dipeptidyl-peptidase 4